MHFGYEVGVFVLGAGPRAMGWLVGWKGGRPKVVISILGWRGGVRGEKIESSAAELVNFVLQMGTAAGEEGFYGGRMGSPAAEVANFVLQMGTAVGGEGFYAGLKAACGAGIERRSMVHATMADEEDVRGKFLHKNIQHRLSKAAKRVPMPNICAPGEQDLLFPLQDFANGA